MKAYSKALLLLRSFLYDNIIAAPRYNKLSHVYVVRVYQIFVIKILWLLLNDGPSSETNHPDGCSSYVTSRSMQEILRQ